jgi:hypothetical protein
MAYDIAISKYLSEIGRRGGKASGKARMTKLTQEQRVAVARIAAAARWAKRVVKVDLQLRDTVDCGVLIVASKRDRVP